MNFEFETALPVLEKTPDVLQALLAGLPEKWVTSNEGPGTWSPYDVVGHLIHGERTDWLPRCEHLLQFGESVPFPVFDREAMLINSAGSSLSDLLQEFAELRKTNLTRLSALNLSDPDLDRRGHHPEFRVVTLGQLLATWVAHDLSHVSQVVRTMTKQYSAAVGPWGAYLSILRPD